MGESGCSEVKEMETTTILATRQVSAKPGGDFGPHRLMRRSLLRLLRETCGQDLTEYALILVLLALAAIAGVSQFALQVSKPFDRAAECHAKAQAEQARACKDTGPRTPPKKK